MNQPYYTTQHGNVIRQYGRFLLRELIEQKAGQTLPVTRYALTLNDGTRTELTIGNILIADSSLQDVLALLNEWVEAQKRFANILRRRNQQETNVEYMRQKEEVLKKVKQMLHIVDQAIQEIKEEHR
jgi:UDP-2,3-diacylglucosamine pyrophosphatase LpxH